MITIHYRVTLEEPAILTAIEGEPNSSVSYDFIPGSVMRGFFIGAKIRQDRELDLDDVIVRRRFFSNQTRYLNLYPVINNRRSLPVPVSWSKKKYPTESEDKDNFTIYDGAIKLYSGTEKLSSVGGFVPYNFVSEETQIYKPKHVLNIHTQRARRSPKEQQVYRYDALAPGQTFEGMILCQNEEDAKTILGLMERNNDIHIGGARSAGYGLAQIIDAYIDGEWQEVDHQPNNTIVLTLLSDVILRDKCGHYSPTCEALQMEFKQYGITCGYNKKDYINLQTTLVGGFNRKWGLPLPQTPALKRGSVVKLTNVQYDKDQLWELIRNGIGERTNDGFGQIALNWQQKHKEIQIIHKQRKSKDNQPESTPDGIDMWIWFEARINKTKIDSETVYKLFTEHQYKITGNISRSQLSNLRYQIARELRQDAPTLEVITKFLNDINGETEAEKTDEPAKQKIAGKQFEDARIQQQSLTKWLKTPTFNSVDDELTKGFKNLLQLIDIVLERAHKERNNKKKAGV
jgi:CRISPR-associated protein Csx10